MNAFGLLLVLLATVQTSTAAPCAAGAAQAVCDCGSASCQIGDTCDAPNNKCTPGNNQQPQNGNGQQGGQNGNAPAAPLRCQNKDGSLLPSATICEDKAEKATCDAVFGKEVSREVSKEVSKAANKEVSRVANKEVRREVSRVASRTAAAATNDRTNAICRVNLADLSLKCAKTCKVCCETAEHGCEDDPSFGIDCEQQKAKCKVPQWSPVMGQACPLTCGLCHTGACKDEIQGCSSLKTLCRDFSYRDYMAQNCAKTCGACQQNGGADAGAGSLFPPPQNPVQPAQPAPTLCVDNGLNCASFVGVCNEPGWRNQMQVECRKTCGFC